MELKPTSRARAASDLWSSHLICGLVGFTTVAERHSLPDQPSVSRWHDCNVHPHFNTRMPKASKKITQSRESTILQFFHHSAFFSPADCFWNALAFALRPWDLSTS